MTSENMRKKALGFYKKKKIVTCLEKEHPTG